MEVVNKLRKGQVKILGKTIPLAVLILVLLAGTATAVLVGYISNSVTADVTVDSPLKLEISPDNTNWYNLIHFGTNYGGETVTIYTKITNNANATITGTVEVDVNNPSGITCADFTVSPGGATCAQVDANNIKYTTPGYWTALETDTSTTLGITFKEDAMGVYTFTGKIVP